MIPILQSRRARIAALVSAGCIAIGGVVVARRQCASPPLTPGRFIEEVDLEHSIRGNVHTHSSRSDGDSPPEDVAAWYRDNGYSFVALTDHNSLTDPAPYDRPGFIAIAGEEITMRVHGAPVHVNALCTQRSIGGGDFPSVAAALTRAVRLVQEQGGVALVNHPNFEWALSADDLPHARGAALLEVWSGHPHVRSDGDSIRASVETMWDSALTAGENFAPAAVDDMHHLSAEARDPASRPGRAWIEVFAEPTHSSICEAMARGRLYASSGPKLRRIRVQADVLTVWPESDDAKIEFVRQRGEVAARIGPGISGVGASYRLVGGETYIRARIMTSNGRRAWTPAYRVGPVSAQVPPR